MILSNETELTQESFVTNRTVSVFSQAHLDTDKLKKLYNLKYHLVLEQLHRLSNKKTCRVRLQI